MIITLASVDLGKAIVLGIVANALIYGIYLLTKRKEIKQDWKRGAHQKQVEAVDKKISELKILRNQDIIDQTNFEKKVSDLEDQKRELKIDYYLKLNKRYDSLKRALDKGFIDQAQFEFKTKEIRDSISKNLK